MEDEIYNSYTEYDYALVYEGINGLVDIIVHMQYY